MKTKHKKTNLKKLNVNRVAKIVALILLIPLAGNLFVDGWNWGILDFVIMGALLFITGLGIDFAVKKFNNPLYRLGACIAIVLAFLLVWAELAVDAVSQFVTNFF